MNKNRLNRAMKEYRSELGMLGVLLIFVIIMSFASPYFMTQKNLMNVFSQIAVLAIIAIGQTFVIVTSGIDLSVGAILGLTSMLMAMTMVEHGIASGIIVALVVGTGLGAVNGILVGYLKLPAFIATLGMMSIARSLTYVVSDGNAVTKIPGALINLTDTKFLGIPVYFAFVILLFVIWSWVANRTKIGRFAYAIGSNEEAARLSGINVALYKAAPYVIVGFLIGIASLIQASRLMAVDPTTGTGLEMDTIAGVVIGGTSLMGGRGTLAGTAIGIVLTGVLRNSLNLLGVNPFWQGTAIGAVIIIAVLIEKMSHGKSK